MKVRTKCLVGTITTLAVSLLIWNRKFAGEGTSDSPELMSLEEFSEATPQPSMSQRMLFFAGNRLCLMGDIEGAHKVYNYLLQALPGNEALEYNFDLSCLEE